MQDLQEVEDLVANLTAKDAQEEGYFWANIVPELTKLAEAGNGEAALEAGRILSHGFDIKSDFGEAARLLELAVTAGVADAKAPLLYCVLMNQRLDRYADMLREILREDPTSPRHILGA